MTVELGFSSDMGVTNSRYPEEVCQGQAQWMHGVPGLQVSSKEMENVDLYLCSLGFQLDAMSIIPLSEKEKSILCL